MTPDTVGGGRQNRLPSLTGMRFIAAAAVFLFHAMFQLFFANQDHQAKYSALFGRSGYLGVGFFFILSGFVLTWSARSTDTTLRFWRRRFFKIYPNHVFTFLAAFILLTQVAGMVVDKRYALLNLLLVQAWFPQFEINNSVNNISWSLSCEALFYLCFPLLIALIRRIRPERLWAWAFVVLAGMFVVPSLSELLPYQPQLVWAPASENQFWFIYFFPPVRMLDFILGIIVARIVLTGRRLPLRLGGAVALAVAAYAVGPLVLPGKYTLVAIMALPLALVIAAGAVADVQGQPTWLSSRVMVWLGEISFAFYLWHSMVITYGHRALGATRQWSTPAAIGVIALLFAVTVVLSWLLFTYYERPIMRRFASPRRNTPAEPAPVTAAPVTPMPAGNAAD